MISFIRSLIETYYEHESELPYISKDNLIHALLRHFGYQENSYNTGMILKFLSFNS